MYLQLLVCIALACRCSRAMPLVPSQVHGRDTETQTTELRGHDYVLNFLNNRRNFIAADCNISFNGQMVSPHICNTSTVQTFTASAESIVDKYACSIDFSNSLDGYPGERVEGAELALYKLNEANTGEVASYDVYISQRLNNCNEFARVKSISSTESGWQVFNIDTIAVQWSEGDIITLQVLIIRHDGTILPCSSVTTLFVTHTAGEPIPQDVLVNTQPRPQEIKNYIPVVTVFTLVDEIAPSPPPVVTAFTLSTETVPSPPSFCRFFPTRPECRSRMLNKEGPTRSITDSESPDTNQNIVSCSDTQNFVLTIFNFRKLLNKTNCTAPFNGQTVSTLHCNRTAKTKFFCAHEQVDTKQQSFPCGVQFNITADVGETEETNCTAPFHGQTVAAPPCNREATKFFYSSEQVYTESQSFCDVQFNISISAGEMVVGVDLAMYRLQEEDNSESVTYNLLILYKESEIFYSLANPQRRQLNSTASRWEVFGIDSIATAWQPGNTSLVLFKLYVTKFNGSDSETLSCTDIASLFVLNAQVGGSGLVQNSPLEGWENYVPVLTTFSTRSEMEHSSPHRKITQGS